MSVSNALVEKRQEFAAKQKKLAETFEAAGKDLDFSKKSVLDHLGATDSSDAVGKVKALNDIPIGHKVATKDINNGETIIKYGFDIGKAVASIKTGEHAHVHNIKTKRW